MTFTDKIFCAFVIANNILTWLLIYKQEMLERKFKKFHDLYIRASLAKIKEDN